jgi:hypothetical protein
LFIVRLTEGRDSEDVKEYDAAVNGPKRGRAAAPRHSLAEPGGAADAKSDEEEEEEESVAPPRVCLYSSTKYLAFANLGETMQKRPSFNFLGDQSSDGE